MIDPRTFIQDFRALYMKTPQCGSWTRGSENSEYGDITTVSKNCYLCFNSGNCEDSYYCEDCREMTNSIDCGFCETCELCYECIDCNNCYNCNFVQDSTNCNDCYFSYDLRRCKQCIGCVGMRDKEYVIFNEQSTKERYEELAQHLNARNAAIIAMVSEKLEALKRTTPRMYSHQFDTHNCTGDYIYHSKNCHRCFDTRHSEDSGYIIQANLDRGTNDSWDCGPIPTGMDISYDIAYSHYIFNGKNLYWCGVLNNCQWCTNCFDSNNLFGCHYLKGKEKGFFLLNQPVEEKEWEKTTAVINAYLKEKQIFTIYDLLHKDLDTMYSIPPESQTSRQCVLCQKPFELIENEMKFYKKNDIMFPIYCPDCRAWQRIHLRNERVMFKRECDHCHNPLITTYPPDTPHIVYCLRCYWDQIE